MWKSWGALYTHARSCSNTHINADLDDTDEYVYCVFAREMCVLFVGKLYNVPYIPSREVPFNLYLKRQRAWVATASCE